MKTPYIALSWNEEHTDLAQETVQKCANQLCNSPNERLNYPHIGVKKKNSMLFSETVLTVMNKLRITRLFLSLMISQD